MTSIYSIYHDESVEWSHARHGRWQCKQREDLHRSQVFLGRRMRDVTFSRFSHTLEHSWLDEIAFRISHNARCTVRMPPIVAYHSSMDVFCTSMDSRDVSLVGYNVITIPSHFRRYIMYLLLTYLKLTRLCLAPIVIKHNASIWALSSKRAAGPLLPSVLMKYTTSLSHQDFFWWEFISYMAGQVAASQSVLSWWTHYCDRGDTLSRNTGNIICTHAYLRERV